MDFEKVNEFNFLNEEVEEFTSSWSQSLVNIHIHVCIKFLMHEKLMW